MIYSKKKNLSYLLIQEIPTGQQEQDFFKTIKYFDSKGNDGSNKLNILFQFVKDAWKELNKGETVPDMELWKLEGSNENMPQ